MGWLKESNRWKHLIGGCVIGLLCMNLWDAVIASGATGGAMEWKDRSWHGVWDWADFGCTVAGGALGAAVHALVLALI